MRGLMQPMSLELLDRLVLSKPYFVRHGLIVADDGEKIVGFAHAGPAAASGCNTVDYTEGATCMVMTAPGCGDDLAAQLLAASEGFLRTQGTATLHGGAAFPTDPYYLGLYGGSNITGVLVSDSVTTAMYEAAGYSPGRKWNVLQRDLSGFRPLMDRKQLQFRRKFNIHADLDPSSPNWWDACTWGMMQRTEFALTPRGGAPPVGTAMLWDMEPLASSWGVHAMGVASIEIEASHRRQGAATFLLGETLRQMQSHGVTLIEVHVDVANEPAAGLFQKLGFQQVDESVQYQKDA